MQHTNDQSFTTRDTAVDVLRIFLGIALFVKGVAFIRHGALLMDSIQQADISFGSVILAHYVVLAHIGGGLLLAAGFLTRAAAAAQLPVLVGAAIFVHAEKGLFTTAQTLEFTILVSVLLASYVVMGASRWSIDHALRVSAPPSPERATDGTDRARVTPLAYPSPAE